MSTAVHAYREHDEAPRHWNDAGHAPTAWWRKDGDRRLWQVDLANRLEMVSIDEGGSTNPQCWSHWAPPLFLAVTDDFGNLRKVSA